MPKMKTRRCAAKRFSTTGTGKFKRRRQNLRHILTKKDAKRKMPSARCVWARALWWMPPT